MQFNLQYFKLVAKSNYSIGLILNGKRNVGWENFKKKLTKSDVHRFANEITYDAMEDVIEDELKFKDLHGLMITNAILELIFSPIEFLFEVNYDSFKHLVNFSPS